MKITMETVEYLAELSKLSLKQDEKDRIEKELSCILTFMENSTALTGNVLTESVSGEDNSGKPEKACFLTTSALREDVVLPSFERELLLSNAKKRTGETPIVPQTVEG